MRILESSLWWFGSVLLLLAMGASGWGRLQNALAVDAFTQKRQQVRLELAPRDSTAQAGFSVPVPLPQPSVGVPLAMLRVPRLGIAVPVGDGTGAEVLLRGAGWIEGTALPGSDGNVGIAAHRDTYFRALEHVAVDDWIELELLDRQLEFRVTAMTVVAPDAVSVLDPTPEPALTLVTCFPFHHVGNAPQRFIVRAIADSRPDDFRRMLHQEYPQ